MGRPRLTATWTSVPGKPEPAVMSRLAVPGVGSTLKISACASTGQPSPRLYLTAMHTSLPVIAPSPLKSPAGQSDSLQAGSPESMHVILVISSPYTKPSRLQSPPHSHWPSTQLSRPITQLLKPGVGSVLLHWRIGTQTPARHWNPDMQSPSLVHVGSGVGVTVGVDRSTQMPFTHVRGAGQVPSGQAIVGVGVGAGLHTCVAGSHTCPRGQFLSAEHGMGGVGVTVGGGAVTIIPGVTTGGPTGIVG